MKNYDQIKEAFVEAVGAPEAATEETVAKACEAVLTKATDKFGEGVYVTGKLNVDMQGISFRFKRPAIRQRLEIFVPCAVAYPPRGEDIDDTSQKQDAQSKDENTSKAPEGGDPGSTQDEDNIDRLSILEAAAEQLDEEQYTTDGRPEVGPVNSLLEADVTPFTAAERDELWALRSAD